ncbi:hypothetical protein ABZ883_32575 [Streptomyces sp. NPDC046977]|uniref:hypothetical protein n=1 Tax=Streptomyces sp. NPDC046977 TaxID=3154703 RepID=UPI0033FD5D19
MRASVRSLVAAVAAVAASLIVGAVAAPHAQAGGLVGELQISSVVVNSGRAVAVDSSGTVSVPASMFVSDWDGLAGAGGTLYHGVSTTDNDRTAQLTGCQWPSSPARVSATCAMKGTLDGLKHSQAGTWKMSADAYGGFFLQHRHIDTAATFDVLRASKLVAGVGPRPVKGQVVTLSGRLTRANWETHVDEDYAGKQVLVQFCSSTCSAGWPLTTDSNGRFQDTVSTGVAGFWKVSSAATADTAAPRPASTSVVIW